MKIIKIGGSDFIIIPHEFIKVYNDMKNYSYSIEVLDKGKTIIYKKSGKRDDKIKNK